MVLFEGGSASKVDNDTA